LTVCHEISWFFGQEAILETLLIDLQGFDS